MRIKKRGEYEKLINGEEDNTLIVASSGHGKGLFGERVIYDFFTKGWTIICLPSYKMNMELGFSCFKPDKLYHLKKLKFQTEKPQVMNTKFYHFVTNNFPNFELPPFNILTIDIKAFRNRLLCYYLFEKAEETGYIRLLIDTINKLKSNEGLFDLIKKVNKATSKQSKNFGVSASMGDRRHLSNIIQAFEKFRYNPLIFPHNFKYNLDMASLIKDNKHYHIFDSRYINDVKIRDLITLYLLLEIIEVKQKNPNLPPVCVFMDEIKALTPENPIYEFKKPLNKIVAEILSTCRGLGINIIATSQTYSGVANEVRGAFNNVCLGKLTDLKDLSEIAQIIKLDRYTRQDILGLKYNEFYVLNVGDGVDEGSFLTYFAPHMHCERGYNFDRMFKQKYPKKITKHSEVLAEIKDMWEKSKNEK